MLMIITGIIILISVSIIIIIISIINTTTTATATSIIIINTTITTNANFYCDSYYYYYYHYPHHCHCSHMYLFFCYIFNVSGGHHSHGGVIGPHRAMVAGKVQKRDTLCAQRYHLSDLFPYAPQIVCKSTDSMCLLAVRGHTRQHAGMQNDRPPANLPPLATSCSAADS